MITRRTIVSRGTAVRTTAAGLALAVSFTACSAESSSDAPPAAASSDPVAEPGQPEPAAGAPAPGAVAPPDGEPSDAGSVEPIEGGADATAAPEPDPITPPAEPTEPAEPVADEVLADGRRLERGDVTVPVASGGFELDDASIAVGTDPNGEATIAGRARVPFPTDGVMAGAEIHHLPVGDVGTASGRELAHLGAHLRDDTEYLFVAFDGGLDVGLPFAGQPGYEAIPPSISVPVGQSAVMVIDPADPYFYVGTDCPDLSASSDESDDEGTDVRDENDDQRGERHDRDDDEDTQDAWVTLDPTDLAPGQECGIGISMNGNIPAPGRDDMRGHVVVDGVVPLYAGIELDGSVVVELRDPGVRTVGWGDVLATVPVIDDYVDVRVPLADATVEVEAHEARIGLAYSGSIGGDAPTYELPIVGLPISIPAAADVRWDASVGFVNDGSGWAVDSDSHVAVDGEFGMGLGSAGAALGLGDRPVVAQEGSLRIDRNGVAVTGRIDAGPFALGVAGHAGSGGFELTGTVGVELRLDGLAEASRAASRQLDAAIADIEHLDDEIERAREEVRESRRNRDAGFAAAQRKLDEAIASLDAIDDKVAANEARIAELEGDIDAEQAWYDRLGPLEKGWEWAGHESRVLWMRGEIGTLVAANVAQRDIYRPAAEAVLDGAKKFLQGIQDGLDALPVDTNPKVAGLILLREGAVELLELVKAGVELFEIEGSLGGSITLTIASTGVSGSFVGEVCGPSGCTTVGGGRVQVGETLELCVELPAVGEQCLAI